MIDYLKFFGLDSEPFESGAKQPLVLGTGSLRRAVAWIGTELAEGQSVLCVRGASGVGKTSLASALPHMLDPQVALIPDPTIPWHEIEATIIEQLEIGSYSLCPGALRLTAGSRSEPPVIVVDRAEFVSNETLERFGALLRPAERNSRAPVGFVFIADQDQLTQTLRRLDVSCTLAPLQPREIQRYLEARLLNAGFDGDEIFHPSTCHAIYHATAGIPSGVDTLCTALVVEAARSGVHTIQPELVAWSQGDADTPILKRHKPPRRHRTPDSDDDTAQRSEADLPRDVDSVGTTATESEWPAQPNSFEPNDADPELPVSWDLATSEDDGGDEHHGGRDDVAISEQHPSIPTPDSPTAQGLAPWPLAQSHDEETRQPTRSSWASFATVSAGATLLAALVGVATLVLSASEPDSVARASPPEARISAPSPPGEAAQPTLTASDSSEADSALELGPLGEVEVLAEQPEFRWTSIDEIEAIEVATHPEPSAAASPSLGSAAVDEVVNTGGRAAAPARTEETASSHEPAEERPLAVTGFSSRGVPAAPQFSAVAKPSLRPPLASPGSSEVAKSPPRPVPAKRWQDIAWPQSFLDAQRRRPLTPAGRARLEIPRPQLTGATRESR